jgi:hypothetical protein
MIKCSEGSAGMALRCIPGPFSFALSGYILAFHEHMVLIDRKINFNSISLIINGLAACNAIIVSILSKYWQFSACQLHLMAVKLKHK